MVFPVTVRCEVLETTGSGVKVRLEDGTTRSIPYAEVYVSRKRLDEAVGHTVDLEIDRYWAGKHGL